MGLLHQPCLVQTALGVRSASLLHVCLETYRGFVRFKDEDGSLSSVSGWFPSELIELEETK